MLILPKTSINGQQLLFSSLTVYKHILFWNRNNSFKAVSSICALITRRVLFVHRKRSYFLFSYNNRLGIISCCSK